MKAVLLALQFFKMTCRNNHILIASDNTSVVSYINKQDSTRSAELCALMWRILTWCNLNNVTLRARHIPGSLNTIADSLSRQNQIQPRVVPIPTDLQISFQDMGESPSGPVSDQPEFKTSSLRLSDPGSSGLGSRCLEHPMGKRGRLLFSSHCPTAQCPRHMCKVYCRRGSSSDYPQQLSTHQNVPFSKDGVWNRWTSGILL